MDPVVILVIAMLALGGGGAGGAVALVRQKRRREAMRRAALDKVDHRGRSLSVFDVFWDLGASEYALALMEHHELLLHRPEDFERAHTALGELIGAHGTYTDFIEDNLAAIQEFYRKHRQTGSRRKLPTMTVRFNKLLPVEEERPQRESPPEGGAEEGEEGEVPEEAAERELERELGRVVQDSVEERRVHREERDPMEFVLAADPRSARADGVDIDELVELEPLQMLKNIFDGRLTDEIQKWWTFRHLRAAKSRLDDQLEALYGYYADLAGGREDFYEMLYDAAKRWREEAARIEQLADDEPWRAEPFEDCARELVDRAARVAHQLALRARYNVDATVERIHQFARDGDLAMAGYLLYLNHHAFFAGRAPDYGAYVERIERQAYRVQKELRKLRREGEI